jgi:hypothetical protein
MAILLTFNFELSLLLQSLQQKPFCLFAAPPSRAAAGMAETPKRQQSPIWSLYSRKLGGASRVSRFLIIALQRQSRVFSPFNAATISFHQFI